VRKFGRGRFAGRFCFRGRRPWATGPAPETRNLDFETLQAGRHLRGGDENAQSAEASVERAARFGTLARVSEGPAYLQSEPVLVFAASEREPPVLELRVNFGVFAGREATAAEIDSLAKELLAKVDHVSIISERHHEIGLGAESAVHQLRIEIPAEALPLWGRDVSELRGRLIEVTERWALACIADRHEEVSET
jgi:hypothetical protein